MTNLQDFTNRSEVGTIKPWGKSTAPSGYLLCDGTAVSRTTYAELYVVLGDTYGAAVNSTIANNQTVTVTGAISNTSLTEAQLASHKHNLCTQAGAGASGSGNQEGCSGFCHGPTPNLRAQASAFTITARDLGFRVNVLDVGSGTGHTHAHTLAGTLTGTVAITNALTGTTAITNALTGAVTAAGTNSFSPYVVVNYIIKH